VNLGSNIPWYSALNVEAMYKLHAKPELVPNEGTCEEQGHFKDVTQLFFKIFNLCGSTVTDPPIIGIKCGSYCKIIRCCCLCFLLVTGMK